MLTQTRRYPFSPIIEREALRFPNNAKIAVVIYLNIEHFPEERPGPPIMPQTTKFTPDPLNYGWRDYGQRVGLWRLVEILDRLRAPVSVCLNSDVCREYPRIIEAGIARDWEWIGHGRNNAEVANGLSNDDERAMIEDVLSSIQQATGVRPKGWLGPFISGTYDTPDLLAEAGIEYLLDFSCDDQPFPMTVKTGSLLAMPYSVECNDLPSLLSVGVTAEDFGQMLRDQFDVLYAEGERAARVMPICLHTWIAGQAFRAKHLALALDYIAGHDDVWFATAGAINDWYRQTTP